MHNGLGVFFVDLFVVNEVGSFITDFEEGLCKGLGLGFVVGSLVRSFITGF